MSGLFITGTGTDVGKTYVTAALIRALRAAGRPVEVLKPVVSGFDPGRPAGSDPAVLLEASGLAYSDENLDRISPWRFGAPLSPPLAARLEGRTLDAPEVADLCRRRLAEARGRLLLIEGAGGVMSPLDDSRTMLDLIGAVDGQVLLVAGSYLGSISHTLTALHALRPASRRGLAIVVSESLDGPPPGPTLETLRRMTPDFPVFELSRGARAPEALVSWAAPPD
jgi:dethiobiotin synthetase